MPSDVWDWSRGCYDDDGYDKPRQPTAGNWRKKCLIERATAEYAKSGYENYPLIILRKIRDNIEHYDSVKSVLCDESQASSYHWFLALYCYDLSVYQIDDQGRIVLGDFGLPVPRLESREMGVVTRKIMTSDKTDYTISELHKMFDSSSQNTKFHLCYNLTKELIHPNPKRSFLMKTFCPIVTKQPMLELSTLLDTQQEHVAHTATVSFNFCYKKTLVVNI